MAKRYFVVQATRTASTGWWYMKLVRLFGHKEVVVQEGETVTLKHYRGKEYFIDCITTTSSNEKISNLRTMVVLRDRELFIAHAEITRLRARVRELELQAIK